MVRSSSFIEYQMFSIANTLLPVQNRLWKMVVTHCDSSCSVSPDNVKKWDNNWDMRENKGSKAIRQIVLIRHGQYVQGEKGDSHKVLTALGK